MGREHVDAMNLHHVIGTAGEGVDARMLVMAARALTGDDTRQVVRAEADERCALLLQRGEDDLAPFAVGYGFARLRVDDLEVDVVAPHMHAMTMLAVDADAGAVHLGEAVDVVVLDSEPVDDALTNLLARTLRTRNELLELDLVLDAALFNFLGNQQRIARSSGEHRGFHVDHELQLLFGIARTHGDSHGAQKLATSLEADASRPQAVTRRNLNAIGRRHPSVLVATRELDGPVLDVLLGVRDDDRRTGRARRGVDADDLLLRNGSQSKRISLAQIAFVSERQLLEIFLSLDIAQIDALEPLRVERRTLFQRGKLLGNCF